MSHQVKVNAWVCVEDDCSMGYHSSDEVVYFVLGSLRDGFEVAFTARSLAQFVELARHALRYASPDQDHGPVTLDDLAPTMAS